MPFARPTFAYSLFALVFVAAPAFAAPPKALFYLSREEKSLRSFLAHADRIDILAPNWYSVDADGHLDGEPDARVLDAARKQRVAVTPLITNRGFVQQDVHALLAAPQRRAAVFASLIRAAKQHGYAGYQLDFENVPESDRDALTAWVRAMADAMHAAHLQLSIATIPNAPGKPGASGYSDWLYRNWRGAYDLSTLVQSVDLVCLMTYDQHTFTTVPGPVAGWPWVVEQLDYALAHVPADKLALGIPLYGYHWFSDVPMKAVDGGFDKPNLQAEFIDAPDTLDLVKAHNGHLDWDADDRSAFAYFYRDRVREWIFFTDARTFAARYDLVKQKHLTGFASWVLGSEDPGIWEQLPSHVGTADASSRMRR